MRPLLAVLALAASTVGAMANDIVILNGRVIDPETGLDAIRNVAIKGDKIVAISEFPLEGDVVIDATGHIVAPGFIDTHFHFQMPIGYDPEDKPRFVPVSLEAWNAEFSTGMPSDFTGAFPVDGGN